MARPREHNDDTRAALLRAAGERLTRHGVDGVTVRGVAADAGVTTRAVYALFGSRHELLRAMFVDGFAGLEAALHQVQQTDHPLADLTELGLAYRRSALARPHLYHVMFVLDDDAFSPTDEDREMALRSIVLLQAAVQRCVDAGLLEGDPQQITTLAWALVHGLALIEQRGMLGPDPDDTWQQSLKACMAGFRAALD